MDKPITTWNLDDLKQHPLQAEVFGDADAQRMADLVEDIAANGLREPIEILPDGTIICGHQRVLAAKSLQWKEINAWVRDDLAQKGAKAVTERFIEDNLNRRQLDMLDQVRCFRNLLESKQGYVPPGLAGLLKGRWRDAIGKKLGITGRTLARYYRLLEAPIEVQKAFQRNEIKLVDAEKVAGLGRTQKTMIVEAIRDGGNAGQIVTAVLRPDDPEDSRTVSHLSKKISCLTAELGQIASRTTKSSRLSRTVAERLKKVRDEINSLVGSDA